MAPYLPPGLFLDTAACHNIRRRLVKAYIENDVSKIDKKLLVQGAPLDENEEVQNLSSDLSKSRIHEYFKQAMQENSEDGGWQMIDILEKFKRENRYFDFRVYRDKDERPIGIVWMS
eukprot:CAMPEP_0184717558 /NCGR_PEP_ID=MMETSP0314-20130426/6988_1 /TAXON_ID=38298 /ORGANISM="Rhodella maculata, Strain CCMP 736" /LENGTH=116 /DNA_ID=CAMNT_0027181143 /DNA_START=21 /DNA_END=368 /DNA_ORIENTATION=-